MPTVTDQSLPLYFEWGHGQIISTSKDLYIFFNAILQKDLFQNQSTLDAMLECSALLGGTYGMGISKDIILQLGYGHSGETPGFISSAMVNPETGLAIVIVFNTHNISLVNAVISGIYNLRYPQ